MRIGSSRVFSKLATMVLIVLVIMVVQHFKVVNFKRYKKENANNIPNTKSFPLAVTNTTSNSSVFQANMCLLILSTSNEHILNHNIKKSGQRRNVYLSKAIINEELANLAQHPLHAIIQEQKPLLVLITTFNLKTAKMFILSNTIRTWGLLYPMVQPVLFSNDVEESDWALLLKYHKWVVLPIPRYFEGLPIVREMFLQVLQMYNADYYGFANSDIIFDESIVLTLCALKHQKRDLFMTGRRLNYVLKVEDTITSSKQIRTLAKRASMFISNAADYFISTRNGYPWKDMPDFVVGKRGYDNWLMMNALKYSAMTIDATNSVLCLHQTDEKGIKEGRQSSNKDVNMNLMKKHESLTLGHTDCMRWETRLKQNNTIGIQLLKRDPYPCNKETRKDKISLNNLHR